MPLLPIEELPRLSKGTALTFLLYGIELKGYGSGFIGGAGALIESGVYGFFGDLFSHPDGDMIAEFASRHKIKAVSLSDEPLSDNGGLLILREALR